MNQRFIFSLLFWIILLYILQMWLVKTYNHDENTQTPPIQLPSPKFWTPWIKNCTAILGLFFLVFSAQAQQMVRGRVLDAVTNETLAFVNISAGGTNGTTTNIDGIFELNIVGESTELRFSYIGYEPLAFAFNSDISYPTLTIYLNPSTTMLSEVIVGADKPDNPAKEIMRKVIRNKKQHKPERLPFFTFEAYRKIILNPVFTNPDAFQSLQKAYEKRYMGVMETSSQVFYEPNTGFREEIEAVKASGLKEPRFAALTNQLPFFSFYQESFDILDKSFFSPIADGALRKYDYQLTDTLYSGTDSVFVIAYQPKKNKKFDALEGVLYVNTNAYALQNVIAEPFEKAFAEMRLEQQYKQVGGKWFPEEILYRMALPEYPSKEMGLSVESRTYVKEVSFSTPETQPKFGSASVKVRSKAYERDSTMWEKMRIKPLDSLEQNTYQYMDSVAKKSGLRFLEKFFNSTLDGLFDVGSLSVRAGDLMHYNEYEGLRPGLGLQTNANFSKRISLGGYVGIGFRDEQVKYGADISTLLIPSKDVRLRFLYRSDLEEAGQFMGRSGNFLQRGYTRNLMAERMNEINEWQGMVTFRPFQRLATQIRYKDVEVNPLFNYQFNPEQRASIIHFDYREGTLQMTWSSASTLLINEASGPMAEVQSEPPVISFAFSRGEIASPNNANTSYERYELSLAKSLKFKGGTHLTVNAEAGIVTGEIPYFFLFNGKGSSAQGYNWIDVTNTFRTMGIYEFVHNRFANLFLSMGTGQPLFQLGIVRPEPVLVHGSGWGTLTQSAERHQGIMMRQAEKGFHETGIQLGNIISIGYINFARLGLGGGAYYRYGAYALAKNADNFAYKVLLKFTF